MDAGRGRSRVDHGQGRRPPAGFRGARQGRHHPAAGQTHQAGFPSGDVSRESWADHARMRAEVCDFSLDWTPGRRLQYHPRAAHLTMAMVIEAVTGRDFRDVIRDSVSGAARPRRDIFVGVPAGSRHAAPTSTRRPSRATTAPSSRRRVCRGRRLRDGARHGGVLPDAARTGPARRYSPVLAAAHRLRHAQLHRRPAGDHMAGIPMHRGLGPHVRGESDRIRGLGSSPPPRPSATAASARRIAGPTRAAAFLSLILPTTCSPIRGIRRAWTGSATWSTPRSTNLLPLPLGGEGRGEGVPPVGRPRPLTLPLRGPLPLPQAGEGCQTLRNFCNDRISAGRGVSGKLVVQLVNSPRRRRCRRASRRQCRAAHELARLQPGPALPPSRAISLPCVVDDATGADRDWAGRD